MSASQHGAPLAAEVVDLHRRLHSAQDEITELVGHVSEWKFRAKEVSEENVNLRTLLAEAARFYPTHDSDPRVNLIGKEIRDILG